VAMIDEARLATLANECRGYLDDIKNHKERARKLHIPADLYYVNDLLIGSIKMLLSAIDCIIETNTPFKMGPPSEAQPNRLPNSSPSDQSDNEDTTADP